MKYLWLSLLFVAVAAIWLYGYICDKEWFKSLDILFSGLAFVGLIVTILLQREELQQNTKALQDQWQEMEKQNINIKRQRFESTLFSMWNLHFESRNFIERRNNKGILAFKDFMGSVIQKAQMELKVSYPQASSPTMYSSCLLKALPSANAQAEFFTIVEPYLSSLRLIHDSIKKADLKDGAEARYFEVMESYLTNYEVMFLVLWYNYLKSKGREANLTEMYSDLKISRYFAFRLEENYELKLVIDSTFV
jgi:hypothetical protein